MKSNQKILLFLVGITIIGFGSCFLLPKEIDIPNDEDILRIGAGADVTGLLLEKVLEEAKSSNGESLLVGQESFSTVTFKDC